ncbi:MAG TPA: YafY family protein [Ktedonobacteraceae bacterium]|nr:YafY family protein [Ktedonobacteraceae bacterium]
MRADRLLSILLLLQVHHRMTARELAKRLEVSDRTIYRDIEALSAAGVPVMAERGVGGGCSLLAEYRTNLTGLTEPEIQAIFLTSPTHLLADLGLRQASEAAFIKLLAALPAINRRGAEYVRQRILIDTTGWHHSEEHAACLPMLQEAIWQERKIIFTYQRNDAVIIEREADPIGLVAKGSAWYLIAVVEGELRNYRASRIQAARMTDEPCQRPPDFDLVAYWKQSSSNFVANLPRYPVIVRATPDALQRMQYALRYARVQQTDAPDSDGWSRLTINFENEREACASILGFGPELEVIEPAELREQVFKMARDVVEMYQMQQIQEERATAP